MAENGKTLVIRLKLSGLNPKETYIVSSIGKLYNGAKVQVK
jgi:hypothetical protein